MTHTVLCVVDPLLVLRKSTHDILWQPQQKERGAGLPVPSGHWDEWGCGGDICAAACVRKQERVGTLRLMCGMMWASVCTRVRLDAGHRWSAKGEWPWTAASVTSTRRSARRSTLACTPTTTLPAVVWGLLVDGGCHEP